MARKNMRDILNEIDPSPSKPGKTLRAFRKNFEIALKELEGVTGIKESNLSSLENDRFEMTSHYAERLSAALGIHPSQLLYPEGWVKVTPELADIEKRAKKLFKRASGH
ncbi:MAG: helix-turn-helix domain-containing protein [Pseudobdellovibrionaceae bacterium]